MYLEILFRIFAFVWITANVYVACSMTSGEMHNELIKDQCNIGRIFANAFYSLAWLLKAVKIIIK